MMTIFRSLLAAAMLINYANASMTVDEYLAQPVEEKVKLLRNRPDRWLADPRQLLRLYTSGLRDPSPEVRRVAAQAAVLLVMGLQSAQGGGNVPVFATEDSASFQRALVSALDQEDSSIRAAAATALANSAAPNPAIENMLLERVKSEPVPEIKGAVMEAMARVGYQSPELIGEAAKLLQSSEDSKALYSASQVMSEVRIDSALDTLIAVCSKASLGQQHALRALAAYGKKASRAVPTLEALVADTTMSEDIRNLARITLQSIREESPQDGAAQGTKPIDLWPLAVSQSSTAPAVAGATPASSTPVASLPRSTSSAQATPAIVREDAKGERSRPLWVWFVGAAAILGFAVFIAKRRN